MGRRVWFVAVHAILGLKLTCKINKYKIIEGVHQLAIFIYLQVYSQPVSILIKRNLFTLPSAPRDLPQQPITTIKPIPPGRRSVFLWQLIMVVKVCNNLSATPPHSYTSPVPTFITYVCFTSSVQCVIIINFITRGKCAKICCVQNRPNVWP